MDADLDDYEFTWKERLITYNRFTLWAGSWLAVIWHRKIYGVYDELMIRLWPYEVLPHEWRSLVFWKSGKGDVT